jgi:uncharacterized LabA/DUF88 family protein
MQNVIYFFIDGGYVRSKYAYAMRRVFLVDTAEPEMSNVQVWCYSQRFGNAVPQRFFYYDCLHDSQKDGETADEFKVRVDQQEVMFGRIQSLPGFHVRLGSLSGSRKKLRQKKVDVLLAVEMLDHSFRKNMTAAFLVAGDGDFTPAVEAVTRLGMWVQVYYDRNGASKELILSADMGISLSFNTLWTWGSDQFKRSYQIPRQLNPADFQTPGFVSKSALQTGKNADGENVMLRERGDKPGEFFIHIDRPGDQPTVVIHNDLAVLRRYYQEYGCISWDRP